VVYKFGTELDGIEFRMVHNKIMSPLFGDSTIVELFPTNMCLAEEDWVLGSWVKFDTMCGRVC